MTRMSAAERREQLVAAAIRVMTRDGVVRATTRAIASEAGMPLGVFHYAFRSKAELMAVVTETIAQQSKAEIDAAMIALDGSDNKGRLGANANSVEIGAAYATAKQTKTNMPHLINTTSTNQHMRHGSPAKVTNSYTRFGAVAAEEDAISQTACHCRDLGPKRPSTSAKAKLSNLSSLGR